MQEGLRRQEETLASRVPLSSTDWHNYEGHYLKFHRLDRKPGFFKKQKTYNKGFTIPCGPVCTREPGSAGVYKRMYSPHTHPPLRSSSSFVEPDRESLSVSLEGI